MVDEYQVDGDTVIEKDASGNTVIVADTVFQPNLVNVDDLQVKSQELQAGLDDRLVPISNESGVIDSVPISNAKPVNDAITAINNAGGSGTILLPPTSFTNDDPIIDTAEDPDQIAFVGHGIDTTQIRVTNNSATGIIMSSADGTNAGSDIYLDGFSLRGNGGNRTAGNALNITSNPQRFHMGPRGIQFLRWDNSDDVVVIDGKMFQSNWQDLKLFNNGAGDQFRVGTMGTNNYIGQLTIKAPGGNIPFDINRPGGELTIEQLNVSNDANRVGNIRQANEGITRIETIHFEGSQPGGTQGNCIFLGDHDGVLQINAFKIQTGDFDETLNTSKTVGGRLEIPKPLGNAPNNNVLRLGGDLTETGIYAGPSSDVRNASGSNWTDDLWCQGDGVYKVSSGTGFDSGPDRKV